MTMTGKTYGRFTVTQDETPTTRDFRSPRRPTTFKILIDDRMPVTLMLDTKEAWLASETEGAGEIH